MNDKHFIWLIPLILIIGFIIGYISGLHIPKNISIGFDTDTLKVLNNSFDSRNICVDYRLNLSRCEYENEYLRERYEDNNFTIMCFINDKVFKNCYVDRTVWNNNLITYEVKTE